MKLCLVTTFPPSQGGLSEYGLHIAQELRRDPFLSLTVLADEISPVQPELEGFSVLRCWSFNDLASPIRLLKTLQKLKPDVVWFNLLFSTFGRNPLVAFSGLMTPLLARLSGRYTHVTLHHLMDTVDLKDAGIRYPATYRMAGAVATRMLLLSNSVSVLMPGYRKILHEKYGRENVHVRSHGILTTRPEYPDFSRRGNPEHRILAFGKWGTYKRLELLIEAFHFVAEALPNVKLVVAGGNHPQAPGYVESVKKKWAVNPRIEFTGYLEEDRLPDIFQTSSVTVMPYSSSAGCSGVAHLACAYGVPIVSADLPDFRQMADGEDIAIEFYQPGNAQELARCLIRFLTDPEKQQTMAVQNFSTALRMTMPTIVQKYLRHFELEQRAEALRYVTKFRKLPSWMPSKAPLLRLMTRNSLGWTRRSAIRDPANQRSSSEWPSTPSTSGNGQDQYSLLDGYGNGRRELAGTGIPMNGDGVGGGSDRAAASTNPPTRSGDESKADQGADGEGTLPAPAWGEAHEGESGYAQGKQPPGIGRDRLPPLG
jgi:glycosyltransferase involved in cell wall biosynthesis